MKQLLIFLFVFSCFTSIAQNEIKDSGMIQYEVIEVISENFQAKMMKGAKLDMYISNEKSYTNMNAMGGMMNFKTYEEKKSGKVLSLMVMMMKKIKVDLSEDLKSKNENKEKIKYSYDKDITKNILGYTCSKVTSSKPDGTNMTLYVTENIALDPGMSGSEAGIDYSSLVGFPLEYTIQKGKFSMTYRAKKVEKEFDNSVFKIEDEGYEEMSAEELNKMMGNN